MLSVVSGGLGLYCSFHGIYVDICGGNVYVEMYICILFSFFLLVFSCCGWVSLSFFFFRVCVSVSRFLCSVIHYIIQFLFFLYFVEKVRLLALSFIS